MPRPKLEPSKRRDFYQTVRLNEYEANLLNELAAFYKLRPAIMVRKWMEYCMINAQSEMVRMRQVAEARNARPK